jgi:hypothetical protein
MNATRSMPIVWQARLAGIAYLLVIGGGLFAQAAVVEAVIVPGDAAETARAVAAHETLWRWGIAVHLAYLVLAVLADVLLYGFFRPVQATIARLALVFGVVSVASEAAILLTLYVPLALLDEGEALAALGTGSQEALAALGTGSQEALAYLAISLYATGFGFPLLLFSGFCVLIGVLILRSRLIPHLIGVFMIVAGAAYFVNSLVVIVSPDLSEVLVPWILLPPFIGELSLALWLTVKGLHDDGSVAA